MNVFSKYVHSWMLLQSTQKTFTFPISFSLFKPGLITQVAQVKSPEYQFDVGFVICFDNGTSAKQP